MIVDKFQKQDLDRSNQYNETPKRHHNENEGKYGRIIFSEDVDAMNLESTAPNNHTLGSRTGTN